jgi:hypothetical protein
MHTSVEQFVEEMIVVMELSFLFFFFFHLNSES